jgi:uncharacterized protein YbbK (DUF523 family)
MKTTVLISACLLGKNCRYDGGHCKVDELNELNVEIIPVCPEEAGGMGTPRPAAEMQNTSREIINGSGKIYTQNGDDVTSKFINGSKTELSKINENKADFALLKSNSPSCGFGHVYDGTFSGKLRKDNGIFAQMCEDEGVEVVSSDNINQFIKKVKIG